MKLGLEKREAVQSKPKRQYKKERMKMFSLAETFMKESAVVKVKRVFLSFLGDIWCSVLSAFVYFQ